jgi:copper homeostasis protein
MNNSFQFEICIDSVQSAINAQLGGAHRVELCDNLLEGGTTPSLGMIKQVKKHAPNVKVFVIIRPRGGDFLYSDLEKEVMIEDILAAKEMGADGIVSGALIKDGSIDIEFTKKMIEACGNLPFTFHRAFDMCSDSKKALEQLIKLGAKRILTSGLQQNAEKGIQTLQELVHLANDRIIIMPGAGINPDNIRKIAESSGAKEFHFSARRMEVSKMEYFNDSINMGGIESIPEYSLFYSNIDVIKQTIKSLDDFSIN